MLDETRRRQLRGQPRRAERIVPRTVFPYLPVEVFYTIEIGGERRKLGPMTQWLTIIGLGEDGMGGLSDAAKAAIAQAQTLVGGTRHLNLIPRMDGQERLNWPSPFSDGIQMVLERRGRPVCILASGDPMHYGVGATLSRHVPPEEMRVLSAPSAFSLAAARLGWALQDCVTLTVHGRPIQLIHPHLHDGAKLLILSEGGHTPAQVAETLCERDFADSVLVVLEHMGGPDELRRQGLARTWSHESCADLNVVAVECRGKGGLSIVAGLPDDSFHHDGQLTKRDVRAVTLSRLAPQPGQLLWDVGAGCGSIGIEWMRSHPSCRAIAIEANAHRQTVIAHNAQALGVPGLTLVAGHAPTALTGLPRPDAIFIGGGLTGIDVPQTCWEALAVGGKLVANGVTLESVAVLVQLQAKWGGELTEIQVSHADPLGRFHVMRAALPVTLWSVIKN